MALMTWPMTSDGAGAVTYTANKWRTLLTNIFGEGVLGAGSFVVSQRALGANMTLDITTGVAVVKGDNAAGQGNYLVEEEAVTASAVTITTAHATLTRWDLVGIQINDPSEGGAAGRNATFVKVTGTASGTPAAPAVPSSFIKLYRVVVGPGVTSITNASIIDERAFATLAHDVVDGAQASRLGTNDLVVGTIVRRSPVTGQISVGTPTGADSATTKAYVDALGTNDLVVGTIVRRSPVTGQISVGTPTAADSAATKDYVDTFIVGPDQIGNIIGSGEIIDGAVTNNKLADPTGGQTGPSNYVQYRRQGKMVFVWTRGSLATGTSIATLPAGFRPPTTEPGIAAAAGVGATINSSGQIGLSPSGTFSTFMFVFEAA